MKLTTYDGKECEVECIGCDVYDGRVALSHSILYEDDYWRIVQDTENPIIGFFVIGSKRHFRTLNEMNKEESRRLLPLILETRRVMEEVLGIKKVTLIQEDGPETMHFHPWLFPWYPWMDTVEGRETEKIRAIMKYSRETMRTEENIKEINDALDKAKAAFHVSF
jgi:diadenosine tetraphosphate (Ap4A) HIT family hydrolase